MKLAAFILYSAALLFATTFGAANIHITVWISYLALGAACLAAAAVSFRTRPGRPTPSVWALGSALAFGAYVAVRAWVSDVSFLAREDLFLAAAAASAYLPAALYFDDRRSRRWLLGLLLVIGTLHLAVALYQFARDPEFTPLAPWNYSRVVTERNAAGFYQSENHFAGFLAAPALVALGMAIFARISVNIRLLLFFLFAMFAVGGALSTSRGGLLALGVGTAVLLLSAAGVYLKARGRYGVRLLLAAAGVAAAVLAVGAWLAVSFLREHYGGRLFSAGSLRPGFAEMAVKQHETAPLLGTGARSYEYYSRTFRPDTQAWVGTVDVDPRFAHNDYLQLLAEYGWIGLALGVGFLLCHLGGGLSYVRWHVAEKTSRAAELASDRLAVCLASLAVLGAFAAHALVDFNLHLPSSAVTLALFCGMLANPGRERTTAGQLPRLLRAGMACVAVLAGGVLVYHSVTRIPAEIALERGERLRRAGDYLASLSDYLKAIERDPLSVPAYHGRGHSLAALGYEEEDAFLARAYYIRAIESYHEAAELYPQDVYSQFYLAEALSEARAYEDADRVFGRALELAPNLRDLWLSYGRHLVRSRQFEKARAAFDRVLKLHLYGKPAAEVREWLRMLDQLEQGRARETPQNDAGN